MFYGPGGQAERFRQSAAAKSERAEHPCPDTSKTHIYPQAFAAGRSKIPPPKNQVRPPTVTTFDRQHSKEKFVPLAKSRARRGSFAGKGFLENFFFAPSFKKKRSTIKAPAMVFYPKTFASAGNKGGFFFPTGGFFGGGNPPPPGPDSSGE